MQYAVQVTVVSSRSSIRSVRSGEVEKPWTRIYYVPAFGKSDAQDIVHGYQHSCCNHIDDGQHAHDRSARVVAVIRTAKGNAYLDLETLNEIAEEYTAPQQIAAE